jgi:hypothetical protein
MGMSGKGVSLPPCDTLTTLPSGRILAVIVVLLMFFRPSGRNDSNALATLRISHVDDDAIARADQINAFFSVIFAIIKPLHSEGITEGLDRLVERDAVLAPVNFCLVVIPFKFWCYYGVSVLINSLSLLGERPYQDCNYIQ